MTILPAAQRRYHFPVLEIAGISLILISTIYLLGQLGRFSRERRDMPPNLVLAGVPVSGLRRAEAQAAVEQVYGSPITVLYRDQVIMLDPAQIGFRVDSDAMLSQAAEEGTQGAFWAGFWDYIWLRPTRATEVNLIAEYSDDLLRAWLTDIAIRYDSPPRPAQPVLETLSFAGGQPGYTLNQEASREAIIAALFRPTDRTARLVVTQSDAPQPDLQTLQSLLIQYLTAEEFRGVVSAYVIDLQTGEEMELDVDLRQGSPIYLNCEVPYASTSTMKIPIMVDFFRYLDWTPTPGSDDYKNLDETITQSGNISANAMLYKIGFEDFYEGANHVTEMAQYLGLINTFIVAPYEDEEDPIYYSTPAREAMRAGQCVDTKPDPYMQTTVRDLAMILDMIYQCAEFNGGALIAAYPNEITQDECRMMIDFLSRNEEGVLIMAGVPADVEVAHKHGWTTDTHGDAGIVFSPGGDYVLSMFLWADTDWLPVSISFPLIEGMSAATFNYFNPSLVLEPRRGLGEEITGGN